MGNFRSGKTVKLGEILNVKNFCEILDLEKLCKIMGNFGSGKTV